jgi:hypothetical protein
MVTNAVFTTVTMVTELIRADGRTDVAKPVCVLFTHFVQRTHNKVRTPPHFLSEGAHQRSRKDYVRRSLGLHSIVFHLQPTLDQICSWQQTET